MTKLRSIPQLVRTVALILVSGACGSLLTGVAFAQTNQPNMVNAKNSILQGIMYLQRADPDKGGHRTQAINFAQRAVNQINAGISYAKNH